MKPLSSFGKSFLFALRGLQTVWLEERSFQVQSVAAVCVIGLMFVIDLKPWEYVIVTLVLIMVLVLEILNTIVERFVDMVKPRLHSYVGTIKDMMAGAVLLMSLAAVAVGVIIFFPHFWAFVIQ
ncbi:MAG: hypothetical protein A2848_00530 [Candidatus Magasanikbacteria bacterium RIFCSPHIGHO2_01_FULL_50_8]|uniref:Diacylglycerol kinase n=2 Tax=Candidatus Magasanikiibacteriota TaxID=1752731 RepID=A0A1F6LQQ2_9BACT|nr:MAG: hypothetical protein A2848_00530 [Candidatus Magasanikbacteria bacterium RIFCSPHIGHO2_01_FULL_50_8]OGH67972.1 MAG: hypothetical protein A3C15_00420 [Candidatus Magasanikbacteria bacterium RIFCSPHIGHO2_02_FULL_50_9b]